MNPKIISSIVSKPNNLPGLILKIIIEIATRYILYRRTRKNFDIKTSEVYSIVNNLANKLKDPALQIYMKDAEIVDVNFNKKLKTIEITLNNNTIMIYSIQQHAIMVNTQN